MFTEDQETYLKAILNTPFSAIYLKKRGKSLNELIEDDYGVGVLVSPMIVQGKLNSQSELDQLMTALSQSVVIVRGHGWAGEKRFVWTGTTQEFIETWTGD
jgi:hypothetical protein